MGDPAGAAPPHRPRDDRALIHKRTGTCLIVEPKAGTGWMTTFNPIVPDHLLLLDAALHPRRRLFRRKVRALRAPAPPRAMRGSADRGSLAAVHAVFPPRQLRRPFTSCFEKAHGRNPENDQSLEEPATVPSPRRRGAFVERDGVAHPTGSASATPGPAVLPCRWSDRPTRGI